MTSATARVGEALRLRGRVAELSLPSPARWQLRIGRRSVPLTEVEAVQPVRATRGLLTGGSEKIGSVRFRGTRALSVLSSFKEDPQVDRAGCCSITITATVKTTGQTGVEIEALTAPSVAALTIYDMCKSVDRGMSFTEVCLLSKSGGKSGASTRER